MTDAVAVEGAEQTCSYDGAPGVARCAKCDEVVCAHCHGSNLIGFCLCRHCRRDVESRLRTPWEMARTPREQLQAFFPTLGEVLKRPNQFFLTTIPIGPVLGPVVFAIICLTTGIFFRRIWNWLLVDGYQTRVTEAAVEAGFSGFQFFVMFLGAAPFTAILGFTLHTIVFHLLARAMDGKAPWHVSARVTAYSSAAIMLQLFPPIASLDLGHFAALLWLIFLESHAVRAYHALSFWRGTAVVFSSMFVLLPFMG